jgi:hypothetical protein
MSSLLIDRVVATVFKLAEQQLAAGTLTGPLLALAGPRGEAVIRLDLDAPFDDQRTLAKADLIATALKAEACAWAFPASLIGTDGEHLPIVVVAGEHLEGGFMTFAAPALGADGPHLRPLAHPLAACASADAPGILRRLLRSHVASDSDTAEAWRRLEAMGVTLGETRRAVH